MKIRLFEGRDLHPLVREHLRDYLGLSEATHKDGKPIGLRAIDAAILDKCVVTNSLEKALIAAKHGETVLLIEEGNNEPTVEPHPDFRVLRAGATYGNNY